MQSECMFLFVLLVLFTRFVYLCSIKLVNNMIMANKNPKKIALSIKINTLTIGKTVTFPIERMAVVKNTASYLGTVFQKKFTTHMDRDARTITVKRLS